MKTTAIPLLGYALLGLLHQKERSGYDLRKVFTHTPVKHFSDSPGAIYPALRRLERRRSAHGSGSRKRGFDRWTKGLSGINRFDVWG